MSAFDIASELYLLRLVPIVFALAVIVIAWAITKRVFPSQPQFWLAIPAFVLFLPMHTHIFASVNTDVFAILLTSLLLFVLISIFDTGASMLKVALVIILVFLAFLTKRTVIFTLLWVGLTAVLFIGYRRQWGIGRLIGVSLGALVAISLGLWLVILNSAALVNPIITLFNMNIGNSLAASVLVNQHLSFAEVASIYIKSGLFAFITFWGDFGGANINIPWPWAWGLMALCSLLIFGAVLYLFRAFRAPESGSVFQRNVFIIFILGIGLSLMNAFFPVLVAGPTWGPPARYFFPVIIPIAAFFFLGAWQLFPARYRPTALLPLWLFGLIAYDALVVIRVLVPFLYG